MKAITLLLEEDEVMLIRMQVRMMQIMLPESNDQVDAYIKKILDATNDISNDTKKEIGMMQRAMRRVKQTIQYSDFMDKFKVVEKLLMKEIDKEKNGDTENLPVPTDKQIADIFSDKDLIDLSKLPVCDGITTDSSSIGANYDKPIIEVEHSKLQRLNSDSPHKSTCPICKEGYLLMERHPVSLLLSNKDRCVLCAQMFEYTDIPDNKLHSL